MKNLQMTINVLIDKEDNEEDKDTEEVPEQSIQKQPDRSFSGGSSKPNKGKRKDTEN